MPKLIGPQIIGHTVAAWSDKRKGPDGDADWEGGNDNERVICFTISVSFILWEEYDPPISMLSICKKSSQITITSW